MQASSRPFYMYTSRALDHDWLISCAGFDDFLHNSQGENLGEVHVRSLLMQHPARVLDPQQAEAFFVPVFEYTSFALGVCNGTSHRQRMTAARDALTASEHWKRRHGLDHVFVSTAWSYASRTRPLRTMWSRMALLSEALRCAMAGRYKDDRLAMMSAVGNCVIEVPYPTALIVWQAVGTDSGARQRGCLVAQRQQRSGGLHGSTGHSRSSISAVGLRRSLFLHFAGSFDVCCHRKAIRCAIGQLMVRDLSHTPSSWLRVEAVITSIAHPAHPSLA